jgi:hypothetical protein
LKFEKQFWNSLRRTAGLNQYLITAKAGLRIQQVIENSKK